MSDYTPPTLVTPTPGGNAGDGSLKGTLTVQAATPAANIGGTEWLKVDSSGEPIIDADITPNVRLRALSEGGGAISLCDKDGNAGVSTDLISVSFYKPIVRATVSTTSPAGALTVGTGFPIIFGLDNRTGLTAADASATTLYTTTAAGQVYEVAARIFGTGGTITSGVYTIGWTEGGTARTATVSITATGTLSSSLFLLQPDSGTAITAQLTTLSGTSPVANVAAVVKQNA